MNAISVFEESLKSTSLSLDQRAEVKVLSDKMAADLWIHFCDHELKHLDAMAAKAENLLNQEVQNRIAVLKTVVQEMKVNGMPDITLLEVV